MNFEMIPAKELDRYTDRQDTFLIDVRPPEEYQQSHIRGAVNIPYQYLPDCCRFPREKTFGTADVRPAAPERGRNPEKAGASAA